MNHHALSGMARESRQAVGFLLGAAVLWSFGGLLIKLISWNPLAIAGARSAIASLVFLAFLRHPRFTWSRAQIGGAVAYAATVVLFVAANKLTSAANAILLQYTAPVYVALFGAWFLGERTTWRDWVTIIAVLGGISLFFLDRLSFNGLWGNVLALLSGLSFACLVLFLRGQKSGSPFESILLGNLLTALIGLPFMISSEPPSAASLLPLLMLGLFQLGLSYILYIAAIKHVTALEAILIPVLEPLLNPIWVFLAIGEAPGRWALFGSLIVLGAITGRYLWQSSLRGLGNDAPEPGHAANQGGRTL